MRIKELLAAVLFTLPALADTSIQLLGYSTTTGEFQLIITGDAAPVTLTLTSLQIDWCKPGGELGTVATPTSPNLGIPNGDGVSAVSITLMGPVTTICDIDPNQAFPGATATVAGVTKPLVLNTVVTFGGTTPQPPPVEPPTAGVGQLKLSWIPPATNTDGSPLSDLAGFKAYWGVAPGSYGLVATLPNPGLTAYTIDNLATGTYFAVVTAFNASGTESAFSNEVSKAVDGGPPPPPPPPPTDPCVLRPLVFKVNTWPGGLTGSRSLSYSTNKALTRLEYTNTGTRVTGIAAVDLEGCRKVVTRP